MTYDICWLHNKKFMKIVLGLTFQRKTDLSKKI